MATSYYIDHLNPAELHALTLYEHRGEDRSITYKYVMSPFYNWLIQFMPMSVAPNTITFIGFLLTVSAHLLLIYHVPHLDSHAPKYVYTLGGLALFIYMVMDNLDGRQARRTNSSSPLGQLFDHGCDAINVTLSGMTLLATVQLGPNWMSMSLLYFLGQLMVFTATLEEYHTGAMVLRELNGPNEGLLLLVAVQLVTGVLGPTIWRTDVPIVVPWLNTTSIPLNRVAYYIALAPATNAVVGNLVGILAWHRRRGHPWPRTLVQLARQSCSIVLFGGVFVSWAVFAGSHFRRQTALIMWLSGGLLYDLISRMMLATLARAPFPYLPAPFVPVLACWLTALLAEVGSAPLPVDHVTLVAAAWTAVYNVWRSWCVVTQLCRFLNVGCFTLQRPKRVDSAVAKAQ